jgi:Fe-S cluster biogenesis protein NfuA
MDPTDIKITAEPVDDETCRFTVSHPVYPGKSASFTTPEDARYSPLAMKLMDVEPVTGVRISNNVVTVTKEGIGDWAPVARQVGAAIRVHMATGEAAVSDEYATRMPSDEDIRAKIEELFAAEINPAVAGHGGYVSLIDVKDTNVYVQMGGGCQGCGAANITLKMGIERAIRRVVPEIGEVFDTTDHAGGANPYYAPSK